MAESFKRGPTVLSLVTPVSPDTHWTVSPIQARFVFRNLFQDFTKHQLFKGNKAVGFAVRVSECSRLGNRLSLFNPISYIPLIFQDRSVKFKSRVVMIPLLPVWCSGSHWYKGQVWHTCKWCEAVTQRQCHPEVRRWAQVWARTWHGKVQVRDTLKPHPLPEATADLGATFCRTVHVGYWKCSFDWNAWAVRLEKIAGLILPAISRD